MKPHDHQLIHSSEESDWRTEPALFQALSREFCFIVDLAADAENHLTRCWYGPGSPDGEDALAQQWPTVGFDCGGNLLPGPVACFLNPPFSRKKSRAYSTGRIKNEAGIWIPHPIDPLLARVYEVETWAKKCWEESQSRESQHGCTIVAVLPFAPQTEWYRKYVYGHSLDTNIMGERLGTVDPRQWWSGHAALEERRFPHRLNFLRPDGTPAANSGVNSVVIKWGPATGRVGPWAPASFYWSHR